jgi:hypothetical protein
VARADFAGSAPRATATIGSRSTIARGARYLGTPQVGMNSMAGQEEDVYSLDHRGRRAQPNSTADGTTPYLLLKVQRATATRRLHQAA